MSTTQTQHKPFLSDSPAAPRPATRIAARQLYEAPCDTAGWVVVPPVELGQGDQLSQRSIQYVLSSLEERGAIVWHRLSAQERAATLKVVPAWIVDHISEYGWARKVVVQVVDRALLGAIAEAA